MNFYSWITSNWNCIPWFECVHGFKFSFIIIRYRRLKLVFWWHSPFQTQFFKFRLEFSKHDWIGSDWIEKSNMCSFVFLKSPDVVFWKKFYTWLSSCIWSLGHKFQPWNTLLMISINYKTLFPNSCKDL